MKVNINIDIKCKYCGNENKQTLHYQITNTQKNKHGYFLDVLCNNCNKTIIDDRSVCIG